MTIHRAKARRNKDGWYIRCAICKTRLNLSECPVPGGMANSTETCYECNADIEVQPVYND
jgi:hypothetical protein